MSGRLVSFLSGVGISSLLLYPHVVDYQRRSKAQFAELLQKHEALAAEIKTELGSGAQAAKLKQ